MLYIIYISSILIRLIQFQVRPADRIVSALVWTSDSRRRRRRRRGYRDNN